MAENIGLMSGAYFLPRGELLAWLNELLSLEVPSMERLCTGAVFCQLLDVVHPNAVALHKVQFSPRNEYDYTANYRLLQDGFRKAGIDKMLPLEKLVKPRSQEILELLQWYRAYWERVGSPTEYDGPARRGNKPVWGSGAEFATGKKPGSAKRAAVTPVRATTTTTAARVTTTTAPRATTTTTTTMATRQPVAAARKPVATTTTATVRKPVATTATTTTTVARPASAKAAGVGGGAASAALQQQVKELQSSLAEHKSALEAEQQNAATLAATVGELESNVNFYYEKLRAIEVILQQGIAAVDAGEGDAAQTLRDIEGELARGGDDSAVAADGGGDEVAADDAAAADVGEVLVDENGNVIEQVLVDENGNVIVQATEELQLEDGVPEGELVQDE